MSNNELNKKLKCVKSIFALFYFKNQEGGIIFYTVLKTIG